MKKLILSIMAAGCALSSFAHGGGMEAGDLLLYGVGSFSNTHGSSTSKFGTANSTKTDDPRLLNWQVIPGIGLNVTDMLTVGVEGGYAGSKYNVDRKTLNFSLGAQNDQIKTYDWGVGIFARGTMPLSKYFFAFGQLGAGYIAGRETYRYTTTQTGGISFVADNNYRGLQAYYMPGIGAKLTQSLGLTFSLGGISYAYRKYDLSPTNVTPPPAVSAPGSSFERKENNFDITVGRQFNLGIQKYIGCGHKHRRMMEPMDDTRQMDTSDDDSNSNKRRKNDDE